MERERTACFFDGKNTVSTNLKTFSLYESTTFCSFFYSEFEKLWLLIVKNGIVLINGEAVTTCKVLNEESEIQYESSVVLMQNIAKGVGLSQVLVEQFLVSNNRILCQKEVEDVIAEYGEKDVAMECLRKNKLFIYKDECWRLNYAEYIRFLERESDPIIEAVLSEFEYSRLSKGISRTFSLHGIWNNPIFVGEFKEALGFTGGPSVTMKGISSWPYSYNHPTRRLSILSKVSSVQNDNESKKGSSSSDGQIILSSPRSLKVHESISKEHHFSYDSLNRSCDEVSGECFVGSDANKDEPYTYKSSSICNNHISKINKNTSDIDIKYIGKRKADNCNTKKTKYEYAINIAPVVHRLHSFKEKEKKKEESSGSGAMLYRGRSISSINFGSTDLLAVERVAAALFKKRTQYPDNDLLFKDQKT